MAGAIRTDIEYNKNQYERYGLNNDRSESSRYEHQQMRLTTIACEHFEAESKSEHLKRWTGLGSAHLSDIRLRNNVGTVSLKAEEAAASRSH